MREKQTEAKCSNSKQQERWSSKTYVQHTCRVPAEPLFSLYACAPQILRALRSGQDRDKSLAEGQNGHLVQRKERGGRGWQLGGE